MSTDYTRIAITEAHEGDEIYQAGEWHRIDGVTPMAHSSNVHVRFTNGGTHNAPAHHFIARRAITAPVCGCCGTVTIPPTPGTDEQGFYCEPCGIATNHPTDRTQAQCVIHQAETMASYRRPKGTNTQLTIGRI